uniref:Sulfur/thiosulfate oxidation protein SoxE n=1 Tax=uncultured bacterium ws406H10 TaxID=1131831 RepID=I1X5E9_9BACT|nr:sulfur/thiosulfate oxidation protein SoxE [uncultured bacterium ws406H10]
MEKARAPSTDPMRLLEKHGLWPIQMFLLFLVFLAGGIGLPAPTVLAQDTAGAHELFKKCAVCHEIGANARNKVGPHLNGLDGRTAGTVDRYRYSKAVKKAGAGGLRWNTETLTEYLRKPRAFLKGTRMSFAGMKDADQLAELVAWLIDFAPDGKTGSMTSGSETELLGVSASALEGDPEYGEYIAGECVTCHQITGKEDGIPSITGWPEENFIHAMFEYKIKLRANPVMQTVTSRLGDEEMAALAAYFATLKHK